MIISKLIAGLLWEVFRPVLAELLTSVVRIAARRIADQVRRRAAERKRDAEEAFAQARARLRLAEESGDAAELRRAERQKQEAEISLEAAIRAERHAGEDIDTVAGDIAGDVGQMIGSADLKQTKTGYEFQVEGRRIEIPTEDVKKIEDKRRPG